MLAVISAFVGLSTVKVGIVVVVPPFPDAAKPIFVLELVQLITEPDNAVLKTILPDKAP
jgi:hypothetical protein